MRSTPFSQTIAIVSNSHRNGTNAQNAVQIKSNVFFAIIDDRWIPTRRRNLQVRGKFVWVICFVQIGYALLCSKQIRLLLSWNALCFYTKKNWGLVSSGIKLNAFMISIILNIFKYQVEIVWPQSNFWYRFIGLRRVNKCNKIFGWRIFFFVTNANLNQLRAHGNKWGTEMIIIIIITLVYAEDHTKSDASQFYLFFPLFVTAFAFAQIQTLHSCQRFIDIKAIGVVSPFRL